MDTEAKPRKEEFLTLGDPTLDRMRRAAVTFCEDMKRGERPYWLTFSGPSGTGKTMLARGITRYFRTKLEGQVDERLSSETERYTRRGGMLEWVRCMDLMVAGRDFGFMPQAREDWFLCLDDIAAEHSSHRELSASKLYDILSARSGKWTVVTSNLFLPEINDRLDARISSRLLRAGAVVIENKLPDFNLRKP